MCVCVFLCVYLCAVCVIIWLSQPSHELFGPGSGTEAGFVQAFSVISSQNCMRSHTHTRRTDETETEEMEMQRLNGIRYGGGNRSEDRAPKTKQIYTLH